MNTKLVLLGALCICCALIGIAAAVVPTPIPTSSEQSVSGSVPQYTITITAPADVSGWTLERYSNNDKSIGTVYISSTAPPGWNLNLDVTSNYESMRSSSLATLLETQSLLTVDNGVTWEDLTTSTPGIKRTQSSSTTPYAFPIWIRQYVTGTDPAADDYSIIIKYSVSVTLPTP